MLGALLAALLLSASASAAGPKYEGSFDCSSATPCGASGEFISWTPEGLAVNEETGDVYVIDRKNDAIQVFDSEGNYLSSILGSSTDMNTFAFSAEDNRITIDNSGGSGNGRIYIVAPEASGTGKFFAFEPDGNFAWEAASTLGYPCGIAADTHGDLWVMSYYNGGEQINTSDGAPIGSPFITNAASPPTSPSLCGISFDSDNALYAVPWGSIEIWKNEAIVRGELTTGSPVVTGLTNVLNEFHVGQTVHVKAVQNGGGVTVLSMTADSITLSSAAGETGDFQIGAERFFGDSSTFYSDLAVDRANNVVYATQGGSISSILVSGAAVGNFGADQLTNGGNAVAIGANGASQLAYVADQGPADEGHSRILIYDIAVPQYALTVTPIGKGGSTINADHGAISNCSSVGGTCSGAYEVGDPVVLTASPGLHQKVTWTGCEFVNGNECFVESDGGDVAVSAFFTGIEHTLLINKTGTGTVACKVGTAPVGPCAAEYFEGTEIELIATPGEHFTLAGLSGGGCTTSPCTITLDGDTTINAGFAQVTRSLGISTAGSGSGTVSCDGGACKAAYPEGATVTLTAAAASGSSFAGWGGACAGTGSCQVTLATDKAVTATFNSNGSTGVGDPGVVNPPPGKGPAKPPVKCKKGFKKKTVKGKSKCVKVKTKKGKGKGKGKH